MNKCDCCGKFGELEEVTIVIKKHKECDVNALFGKVTAPVKVEAEVASSMPIIEDMPPFSQAIIDKVKSQSK